MKIGKTFMRTWNKSDIKIILPIPVYHKMLAYAQAADGEISGFGRTRIVKKKGKTVVTITDIRIFKQIVSSTETTLTTDVLSQFVVDIANSGEKLERWNLWWHSHANMNVFFSTIDDAAIAGILKKKTSKELFYSICINKAGDLVGRADAHGKEEQDVEVIVDRYINQGLRIACEKEVKEKVTYKEPTLRVNFEDSPVYYRPVPFKPTVDRAEAAYSEGHWQWHD